MRRRRRRRTTTTTTTRRTRRLARGRSDHVRMSVYGMMSAAFAAWLVLLILHPYLSRVACAPLRQLRLQYVGYKWPGRGHASSSRGDHALVVWREAAAGCGRRTSGSSAGAPGCRCNRCCCCCCCCCCCLPPCAKAWSTTTSGSPRAMRAWSSASGARRSAQTKAPAGACRCGVPRARPARAAGTMSTPTEKKSGRRGTRGSRPSAPDLEAARERVRGRIPGVPGVGL